MNGLTNLLSDELDAIDGGLVPVPNELTDTIERIAGAVASLFHFGIWV